MSIFSRIFFGNETSDDDKSFVDTNSGIQYTNHSKDETLDHAARFEEHGDSDIRTKDGRDSSDVSDSSRFNTAIFEVDEPGFYYPSELDPGNPRNPSNQP
jgi:hypothetical protein